MTGLEAIYLSSVKFSILGNLTDVFKANVKVRADCGQDGLRYGTVSTCSWADGTTDVTLKIGSDELTSNLAEVWYEESPHMDDGRPIVRADTRPLDTQTYFTMCGDDSTSIGGGMELRWDFSNDDQLYTGPEVPSGYKAKGFDFRFNCPVHVKDGTVYFFDAPWGSRAIFQIIVPTGLYYPNTHGVIPASALGLSGNKKYSQATEDTVYHTYLNCHFMYGDCPMGDELNAEGASIDPIPTTWFMRGIIIAPSAEATFKGYASLEIYRCHTVLLPGQTIDNIH